MMPGHRLTGPKRCSTLGLVPPTMCRFLTKNGQMRSPSSNLSAPEELIIWKRRHLSLSNRASSSKRSYLRFEHARIRAIWSAKASWPSPSPPLITRVKQLTTTQMIMSSLRTMVESLMTARTVISLLDGTLMTWAQQCRIVLRWCASFIRPNASTRKGESCSSSKTTSTVLWRCKRRWSRSTQLSLPVLISRKTCHKYIRRSRIVTCSLQAAMCIWINKLMQRTASSWSWKWSPVRPKLFTFAVKLTSLRLRRHIRRNLITSVPMMFLPSRKQTESAQRSEKLLRASYAS